MNRKTLVIAISILLAFCAGLYFWAEWQKQAFNAEIMLGAEIIRGSGRGPKKPERITLLDSIDVDYPPEGAPRPLKHLSRVELYNAAVLAPDHLTDEEVTQAQYEVFFRYRTKEKRDELRQQRARDRASLILYEEIDEQLRAIRAKGGTQ